MKNFVVKYKTYIILVIVVIISITSIVIDNLENKSKIIINDNELEKNKIEDKIAVYISGEVNNPGVYYIEEDKRLNDLIDLCGGFTKEADITDLNLAEKLNDTDKIYVPKLIIEENEPNENEENNLLNINTATKNELKELDGIGETLANNIIEYRRNNKFITIEDILNVNGIGESKYNNIKEYICVK